MFNDGLSCNIDVLWLLTFCEFRYEFNNFDVLWQFRCAILRCVCSCTVEGQQAHKETYDNKMASVCVGPLWWKLSSGLELGVVVVCTGCLSPALCPKSFTEEDRGQKMPLANQYPQWVVCGSEFLVIRGMQNFMWKWFQFRKIPNWWIPWNFAEFRTFWMRNFGFLLWN